MSIYNASISPGFNVAIEPGVNAAIGRFNQSGLRGARKVTAEYLATLRGMKRSADEALARYELYQGVDALPAYDTPVATGSSPISTPPLGPADPGENKEYFFVLRRRNKYGLLSQNEYSESEVDRASYKITVDENGDLVFVKPRPATSEKATAAAAGTVLVSALYDYNLDGVNAADTFVIYITNNGVDPVPGVSPEVTVPMVRNGAFAELKYSTAAEPDGTIIKAVIVTRRESIDSLPSSIVTATADINGPDAPTGYILYGSQAAQEQS